METPRSKVDATVHPLAKSNQPARFVADEPRDPLLPEDNKRGPRSEDGTGGSERKRRRKVLSCYSCRNRKLSCDRAQPACGRCTKAGQPENCFYIDDPAEAPTRNGDQQHHSPQHSGTAGLHDGLHNRKALSGPPGGGNVVSRLEWQDKRIKQLESELAVAARATSSPHQRLHVAGGLPMTPVSPAVVDEKSAVQDRDHVLLRGKSFKTQLYGTTHPGALTAHLPELGVFTRDAFEQFPNFARIRSDMGAMEERIEYAGTRPVLVFDDDLRRMLPTKSETDDQVQLYLDTYGTIYHIIHGPSFREEYSKMWSDITNAKTHTVALVLLMMATVQCLTSSQPWLYRANSSIARENACAIMHACEIWLQNQSQKHVTVLDFQIRFLLFLAKQTNAKKFKRTWTESGTLIRFCMAAGLHRHPDLLRKKTSALDKELRRRLWATAVDFELQAAFDRGMLSMPVVQQSDCPPPANISDEGVDQSAEECPAAAHRSEFTSASYLAIAAESTALRCALGTALNNIRQPLSFSDIKHYTEELEACIRSIPEWSEPGAEIASALLEIKLRQYLLSLHDRQLRTAESPTERTFSRLALLENASKMLHIHHSLTTKGIYALEILCQDQLRCALSICHLSTCSETSQGGQHNSTRNNNNSSSSDDDILDTIIDQKAFRLMDLAIEMLSDKVLRFGREQRQLWITLAANAFMKSRRDPPNRQAYMQEAVDSITRPYYKIIACQQDPLPPSTNTGGDDRSRAPTPYQGVSEYLPPVPSARPGEFLNGMGAGDNGGVSGAGTTNAPSVPGNAGTTAGGANGGGGVDGGDSTFMNMNLDDQIAAWTFEDWSFDPNIFQQFGAEYAS